jgi:hypothetical protein
MAYPDQVSGQETCIVSERMSWRRRMTRYAEIAPVSAVSCIYDQLCILCAWISSVRVLQCDSYACMKSCCSDSCLESSNVIAVFA